MTENNKRVFKITLIYTYLYFGLSAIFLLVFSENNTKVDNIGKVIHAFFMLLYAYDLAKKENYDDLQTIFILFLVFEILEKALFR